jgi:Uncharacterized protein conserved in bacteria
MQAQQHRPILYFDGLCNLCTRAVQYVLKHDKQEHFLFASLQSGAGIAALRHIPAHKMGAGTLVLQYNGQYYVRSEAALRTAILLGGWHKWLALPALLVPRLLRDSVYNLIARYRYKWFGRRNECMVPTPQLKARFIS